MAKHRWKPVFSHWSGCSGHGQGMSERHYKEVERVALIMSIFSKQMQDFSWTGTATSFRRNLLFYENLNSPEDRNFFFIYHTELC